MHLETSVTNLSAEVGPGHPLVRRDILVVDF